MPPKSAVFLLVAGCATPASPPGPLPVTLDLVPIASSGTPITVEESRPPRPSRGPAAAEFEVTLTNGDTLRLSQLRGKVVLLDFFADWAEPSKHAMRYYETLHQRYAARGLAVVGLHADGTLDAARAFAKAVGATYAIAADGGARIAQAYALEVMPTAFLIDQQGDVRHVQRGFGKTDDLEARLRELLAE